MPLTKPQIDLHWRAYGAVVGTNHWRMQDSRLVPEANRGDGSQWHRKVWAFAEVIARQNARAVTPDDLRKGAYTFALGKLKSLTKFDNRDLDRVLALMRLLVNPDDLDAVMKHEAYQRGEDPGMERRLDAGIAMKAPEAYIAAVSLGKFGTKDWRNLNTWQKRDLNMTLSSRRAKWNKPARKPEPQYAECPF